MIFNKRQFKLFSKCIIPLQERGNKNSCTCDASPLLSAELQLHIERHVVKATPAYVVRHVVNVAPAEVFSRIARDNEDFYTHIIDPLHE